MRNFIKASSVVVTLLLMTANIAFAQVPKLINYQALLTDQTTGQPVVDATYSVQFSIYDVASGGSSIWSEILNVGTENGLYSILLGSITPLDNTILDGATKFLGIKVGASPELTPRSQIVSVAYAIVSGNSDKLDGQDASEFPTKLALGASDATPPNTGSNQVNWDNLTGVPAGFVDGTDDGGAVDNHSLDAADGSPVDVLFVNNDGNVGIFTTSAVDPLQVGSLGINGSGERATISDRGTLDRLGFAASLASIRIGGKLVVGEASLDIPEPNATMYIAGNVGIGTTNPTEKLTVAGTIESTSGGVKFPDGTVQTTAADPDLLPVGSVLIQQGEFGTFSNQPGDNAPGANLNGISTQAGTWQRTCTFWSDTNNNFQRYTYALFIKTGM